MSGNADNLRATSPEIVPTKKARMTPLPKKKKFDNFAGELSLRLIVSDPSVVVAKSVLEQHNEKIFVYDDIFYSPINRGAVSCRIKENDSECAFVLNDEELIKQFFRYHVHIPDCNFQLYSSSWYYHMETYFTTPSREDIQTIDDDILLLMKYAVNIDQLCQHVDDGVLDTHARTPFDPKRASYLFSSSKFPSENMLSEYMNFTFMEDTSLVPVCNIDRYISSAKRPTRPARVPVILPGKSFYSHNATLTDGRSTFVDKRKQVYFTLVSSDFLYKAKNEVSFEPNEKPDFETEFQQFHRHLEYLWCTPKSFAYFNRGIILESPHKQHDPDLLSDCNTRLVTCKHYNNDKWTRWVFEFVENNYKGEYQNSEVISDDLYQFINGVDHLEYDGIIKNPLTNTEKKATLERGPCKGLIVRHSRSYQPRIVSLKFRGAINNFEFMVRDKRYLNRPVIEEVFNSLCLRYALRRWDVNNDDSFANFFFYNLFNAGPNRFFYSEALRMLLCGRNSMSSNDVTILMEVQKTFDEPQGSFHFILAVNHMRSKNFTLMEEEIYNYCYANRYGLRIFRNPFTDNYGQFMDRRTDMNFHLNYATLLSITLNMNGLNNVRAYELAQNMITFETHPSTLDDAQLCLALYVQTKLKVLNIYDYNDEIALFSANSNFAKYATSLNFFELETISEHYISDMRANYNKETKALSKITLLIHRYLMAECLSLMYYTISGKHEATDDLKYVQNRIKYYKYWTIFNTLVNSIIAVTVRSHALAAGNLISPRGLPMYDSYRAVLPDRHDPPAETLVCEIIANAYEYAYTGRFEEALDYLEQFECEYGSNFVGFNNLRVALDILRFDACFFLDNVDDEEVQSVLDILYITSPIEGLFRESQWQLFNGTVSKKNIQRLMWIKNVCVQSKTYPLIQVRATILLGQSMIAEKQYDMAITELNTAKEQAIHFGYESLLFAVNRRIASSLFFSGHVAAATELLEKCHPDEGRTSIPQIEIGLYYNLLFRCYEFRLHPLVPVNDKPHAFTLLANAFVVLIDVLRTMKPYGCVNYAVLVEAMDYCRKYNDALMLGNDCCRNAIKEIFNCFENVFPFLELDFTRPKNLQEFEKIRDAYARNLACL